MRVGRPLNPNKRTWVSLFTRSLLVAGVQGDKRLRVRRGKNHSKIREESVPTRMKKLP